MANPLISMAAPLAKPAANPNMDAIRQAAQSAKRMMGMLQAVKDPQQALMMAAQQNPQLNAVLQMCQGKDPQQVFYEECKKSGVNPDEVMNLLK